MVTDQAAQTTSEQKKIKLSYDEYQKIANQLIQCLKHKESEGEDVRICDLVDWYIGLNEDQLDTEAALELSKKVRSIMQRLINKEGVVVSIVCINNDQIVTEEARGDD